MKLGICANWKDKAALQAVKDAGADYVELHFATFLNATEAEISDLNEFLRKIDLPVRAYNGMFPSDGSVKVVGSDADDEKIRAYIENILAKTAVLGAKYVVFGSSAARKRDDDLPRERAHAQIARILKEIVAPVFNKYGMVLVIEPLCAAEDNVINTVKEGFSVVSAVNEQSVALLADFFHEAKMEQSFEEYANYGKVLKHCHIASPSNNRFAPMPNDGDENFYRDVFTGLRGIGYDGGLSVESGFGENFAETYKKTIEVLRNAEKSCR